MKCAALLLCLLILASCGSEASPGEKVRVYYEALESAEYIVTQRTDFGTRVMDFTFAYNYQSQGDDSLTITEPEALKGIKARLMGESAELEFEGMLLALPALPGTGLSPMEVMPFFINQWKMGFVNSGGREKQNGISALRCSYITNISAVSVTHNVWFNEQDLTPLRAELFYDGELAVTCDFTSPVNSQSGADETE